MATTITQPVLAGSLEGDATTQCNIGVSYFGKPVNLAMVVADAEALGSWTGGPGGVGYDLQFLFPYNDTLWAFYKSIKAGN
ncbi:MAG TPA: hypothetical protein VGZ29_05770 [Terriglobia bacterium]|nr:hypothetical protein [Terriglobia bacterium]